MFSRFRPGPPDPLDERAATLAASCELRLTSALESAKVDLPASSPETTAEWRKRCTVAATLLALFPLLQVTRADVERFRRLEKRVRTGLRAVVPGAEELTAEAEGATIPPTGTEQTRTLQEVDETMALALARWVIRGSGSSKLAGSWAEAKTMSQVLRKVVRGYWK
ncbi:MAG: hypothetical protein ABI647_25680 [Gemmatimonadota bacterium]